MSLFNQTEIAELILTRISHDLIGNIGAVANAVELMNDDEDCLSDIKPILDFSSQTLMARLKFFRLAFGLKNAAPKTNDEMKAIAENYLKTIGNEKNPIKIEWHIENAALYKMIYLGIMILADIFIRGGNLEVVEKKDGLYFHALSDTDLAQNKFSLFQNALKGNIDSENPALSAHIVYLQALSQEVGAAVEMNIKDKEAFLLIK